MRKEDEQRVCDEPHLQKSPLPMMKKGGGRNDRGEMEYLGDLLLPRIIRELISVQKKLFAWGQKMIPPKF